MAVARREVCGCGEDCQARVMVGEERVARWVSVGGRGLDVIAGLDGGGWVLRKGCISSLTSAKL